MKTLEELKKELSELLVTDTRDWKNLQINRFKKRVQFLKLCISYMESEPTPEFLKKEVSRLKKRSELIEDSFPQYTPPKQFDNQKKLKSFYYKEMGIPKINQQLKTLRFLIN